MRCNLYVLTLVGLGAFLSSSATRADISSTDNVELIAAPDEILIEMQWLDGDGNPAIFVFVERQDVDLSVELGPPGVGTPEGFLRLDNGLIPEYQDENQTIPQRVNSYLIFYDPMPGNPSIGNPGFRNDPVYVEGVMQSGSVVFDEEILGVASTVPHLDVTQFLGHPDTFYDDGLDSEGNPQFGGIRFRSAETVAASILYENQPTGDRYSFPDATNDGLGNTVSLDQLVEGAGGQHMGDWLRVITDATPPAPSAALDGPQVVQGVAPSGGGCYPGAQGDLPAALLLVPPALWLRRRSR